MERATPSAARRLPRDAALPLRPLTLGELLDTASELVRRRAVPLLATAAVLALLEQAVLVPGRLTLDIRLGDGPAGLSGGYWVLLAIGAGLEALIISWLGPVAGRAAVSAVTGRPAPRPGWRDRLREVEATALVGLVAAVPAALGAFLGPVWLLGYPLFGLAAVAVTIERRGPVSALKRAAGLALRGGMRGAAVRVVGYFSWLLIRFAFYLGLLGGVTYLDLPADTAEWLLVPMIVAANALAYASLAALDAALLIESRVRLEGLDLWLTGAARHREPSPEMLAAR
ncbi:hypothetical protein [Catellatospora citrea]|uniref:Uncharacterized protein n=1 Tax=Catellatospora citrea TaxID=53366 RepID=A0A8J3NZH7_9ACTN|nr:hypothetical protein [Catellatospora citrea]RKE07987.1 hypothetical protein C8E86_2830 [Catellatospora citrea]GIF98368.1 hypothetical protein Cci01nite_34620 [Catellatospora citrea]